MLSFKTLPIKHVMKKYKFYIPAILALIFLSGCTDNFEDINTDKNKVTAENFVPVYNLTRAQLEYSGNNDFSYEVWRVNIIYCGMMMQQLANTSWYAGDKYMQNDGWAASYFDVAYNDQVKYIVDLYQLTKDKPQYKNLHEISRIMKVMIFHRLTDLYGEVPYKEAGLGYYERIFTPEYNTQEEIYTDMLEELESAATALDPAADTPGAGDLIYGTKVDVIAKWKKLAYSLMLRLGMRLTKVDIGAAQSWTEKAVAGGVFTSNDDNAYIVHDATGGRATVNRNSNILAGEWNATGNGEVFLSKTFVDFLQNTDDPRLPFIAKRKSDNSSNPANLIGLPNGLDQNGGATDVSTASNYPGSINGYATIRADVFLSVTGPTFFATYAQVELLLAEAAKRGWNVGGTAASHYNNGVTAAMTQLAQFNPTAVISPADISTYLAANPYNDTFEQINTQYWAANFLDWYETFANWRRSGFPALVPVDYIGNATGGEIPRRMLYPSSEATANSTNYAEAIERQGTNNFLTRVWWDQ
jgi:hypothetical protein